MTKLIQLENYPTGDCMRTVFACLLGKEEPTEVPNFMAKGNEDFQKNIDAWLEENGLVYVEVSFDDFHTAAFIPDGYFGISGKSPRGDWDHIVIGESSVREEDGLMYRDYKFVHDTSPHHDGVFLDGPPKLMGFLTRKLEV